MSSRSAERMRLGVDTPLSLFSVIGTRSHSAAPAANVLSRVGAPRRQRASLEVADSRLGESESPISQRHCSRPHIPA
jgi:hypothetical protein